MEKEGKSPAGHLKLVSSLLALAKSFNDAVEATRLEFETSSDVYHFLKYEGEQQNTYRLFTVAVYGSAECMRNLGVGTRAEMEKFWDEHLGNPDVKEAVDTLLKAEKGWLDFVAEVESKLIIEEDKLTINPPVSTGKHLPRDLCLLDSSSGQLANLESLWKESTYTLFMYVRQSA